MVRMCGGQRCGMILTSEREDQDGLTGKNLGSPDPRPSITSQRMPFFLGLVRARVTESCRVSENPTGNIR